RATAFVGETGCGADAHKHDIFDCMNALDSIKLKLALSPLGQNESADDLLSLQNAATPTSTPSTNPNRIVYLAFTSGTTGVPKGVMHSDNTLLANARAIAKDWHFKQDSVLYTMSPLSHNLGLGAMVSAFACGSEVVVHDLPKGGSLLDRLLETDATFVFGVPTHAIDMLTELRRR